MTTVRISWSDQVTPCARLLEALTALGLLESCCTWEDKGDHLLVHVSENGEEDQGKVRQAFAKLT